MAAPRCDPDEPSHVARWLRHVRWLMLAIVLLSCRTDDSFWSKTFTCDPSDGPQACGTTETGKSMACFPAQAFGAQSFCVEACDPSQPVEDGAFVCLPPGARLPTCHPVSGPAETERGCPAPLQCFATDLARDQGLCLVGCDDPASCAEPLVACDARSTESSCATDRAGNPTACFPASDLGGQDFCAEICDPTAAQTDASFSCVEAHAGSSVRLRICHPNGSPNDPAADCPAGLNCLRTDLDPRADTGLCVAARVCNSSADCDDPTHEHCMSEPLRHDLPYLTTSLLPIRADHLRCIHEPAFSDDCPAHETSLKKTTTQNITDICVPGCDLAPGEVGHWPCPPTFTCVKDAGKFALYQPICAPGLPGYRCSRPEDCLFGACIDAAEGFSVCAVPCTTDEECAVLDPLRGPFLCLPPPTGAPSNRDGQHRYCFNSAAFLQYCLSNDDCSGGEECSTYNPRSPATPRDLATSGWVCRARCDAFGHCPSRGPMPFSCLPNGECDPGIFGIPCTSPSECLGQLECLGVSDSPTGAASICTLPCRTDADCDANTLTAGGNCVAPPGDSAGAMSVCQWVPPSQ